MGYGSSKEIASLALYFLMTKQDLPCAVITTSSSVSSMLLMIGNACIVIRIS